MTKEEQLQFRKEFAAIVYWKSSVKEQAQKISQLQMWDKNGSHEKAILAAVNELDRCKTELKERLKGKSYQEWRDFSKKLSLLNSKLKTLKNIDSITRTFEKIKELSF